MTFIFLFAITLFLNLLLLCYQVFLTWKLKQYQQNHRDHEFYFKNKKLFLMWNILIYGLLMPFLIWIILNFALILTTIFKNKDWGYIYLIECFINYILIAVIILWQTELINSAMIIVDAQKIYFLDGAVLRSTIMGLEKHKLSYKLKFTIGPNNLVEDKKIYTKAAFEFLQTID